VLYDTLLAAAAAAAAAAAELKRLETGRLRRTIGPKNRFQHGQISNRQMCQNRDLKQIPTARYSDARLLICLLELPRLSADVPHRRWLGCHIRLATLNVREFESHRPRG